MRARAAEGQSPISIHALLAESDAPLADGAQAAAAISIHALLAESDGAGGERSEPPARFLSTLSLRRATDFCKLRRFNLGISIHALLAESDPRPRPP